MAVLATSSSRTPRYSNKIVVVGLGTSHACYCRMTPHELCHRTKLFAVDIIRFCRFLPRTDEARVISWQLLRCGPAVGANYRAVCRCRSDKDFIAKLGVVIEEADETAFWLEVLVEAATVKPASARKLWKEADELTPGPIAQTGRERNH